MGAIYVWLVSLFGVNISKIQVYSTFSRYKIFYFSEMSLRYCRELVLWLRRHVVNVVSMVI